MKLNNILKDIQNITPESMERTGNRRDILKNMGSKIAAATVPFVFASAFKAQAKTTDALSEAIGFALTATDMLVAFYEKAATEKAPIPTEHQTAFTSILDNHKAHKAYWYNILTTTGNTLPDPVNYDFTARNAFPKTFKEWGAFLNLAHTLEDVAVRVYTQAIIDLVTNKALRGDAINIRCTIARHAAHIRLLRRFENIDMMPWITNAEAYTIVGELIQGYQGEELTKQAQYEIVNINGAKVTMKAATEAFDEPMGLLTTQSFMSHFIIV